MEQRCDCVLSIKGGTKCWYCLQLEFEKELKMSERIQLKTKSNCRYCLGSGKSTPLFAVPGITVCSCILEQIEILYDSESNVEDNMKLYPTEKSRYTPDKVSFSVKRESEK